MKIQPLNDQHKKSIGIALGLSFAIRQLRERRADFERLPGYNTAVAIVEEVEAQFRAEVAGLNFRAAAAAGVDIQTNMIGMRGAGEIFAEPMDIDQLAEFSAGLAPA